jgi:serralysin
MYGGGGDDTIGDDSGTAEEDEEEGNDYLNGGTGDDSLRGGAGDDYMVGSYGADSFEGGDGRDRMLGGSDADTFLFHSLDELEGDRIGDFDRKDNDVIDVSLIDAKEGGGDNDFKFIGNKSFTKKGQISFKNGKVKFNTDTDDGAEAVMFVNTSKLKASDFDL